MAFLGPIRLEGVLGRGAMGVVWGGVHTEQDLPVAVKVDLGGAAGTELFLHEVRLVTQLDHPNVVRVLDHGRVPERASGTDLPAGARFLVMERCDGSLRDRGIRGWSDLSAVVTGALAGLGHAHARGILHRDVKPGNLLLQGERVVVSDFGVGARGLDRDGMLAGDLVGTPLYMAPEQIEGDIRAQGPWTDLYAVCVMVWQAVAGGHPLGTFSSTDDVLMKHLSVEPGPFVPRFPVPEGLEALLRRGLHKIGPRRFEYAADLAAGLAALAGAPDLPGLQGTGRRPVARGGEGSTLRPRGLRDARIESAALSLWGLREVPFVGREGERSALNAQFREVARTGTARAVVLSGAGGTGKTRLAQWLARRLHEAGEARVLEVHHSPELDPGHGLWAMLARELGVDGVPFDEVASRVEDRVADPLLARDLPAAMPQAPVPLSPRARWHLLDRFVRGLAAERPVLLLVEEVAHGSEALEFVRALLRRQATHPAPVMVLLLVRDTHLADRPAEAAVLGQLAALGVPTLEIGDLLPEQAQALVREHLGLGGELAVEVERRTGGNPLFATQLVGHWLDRGLLRAGPTGLELVQKGRLEVPSQLTDVWASRLRALLEGRPEDDAIGLEIAAWMGMDVDLAAWRAACGHAGLRVSPDLLDALLARRFVRANALPLERFRFAHGLLREALRARSEAAGRGPSLNSAVADALPGAEPDRLAGHLLAAGRRREALPALYAAASRLLESGDSRDRTFIDRLARTVEDLELPPTSEDRGRLELLEVWRLGWRGEWVLADQRAARLEQTARRNGWARLLPEALRMAGRANLSIGEHDHALELLDEAEKRFHELGNEDSATSVWGLIGDVLTQLGRLDAAVEAYRFASRSTAPVVAITARLGAARVAKRRGDPEEALSWLEPEDNLERGPLRGLLAPIVNERGEILRAQGRLEEAERTYERAAELYRALGNPSAAYPLLNLGLLQVLREDWEGGRAAMEGLLRDLAGLEQPRLVALARGVLLPCLAALGEGEALEEHARALEAWLEETDLREPDLADLLRKAAGLADRRGVGASAPMLRARATRLAR